MRLLVQYLTHHKKWILLALLLAAVNQVFSLFDPMIMGKYIIDPLAKSPHIVTENGVTRTRTQGEFIRAAMFGLSLLIGTAMVSRIAKAFQDYVLNIVIQKTGAHLYTDGLQHAMQLPFAEFEDQRSGETLSILQKVRIDSEKFITSFVNILFAALVGIVFVIIYAATLPSGGWLIMLYLVGALLLSFLTSILSRRIKTIQKNIVKDTTALSGATTESLRNIELVKSLGLTGQEIARLNANTYKILDLELRKVKSIRAISFVQGTVVNFLRQCIIFALLYFIFQDRLTIGQMITMQFYSFFIFGPLQEIGNVILSYREAEASLNNLKSLLATPVEKAPAAPRTLGPIETLSFRNVNFQHNTALRPALKDVSFDVQRGETIAFVGPSGSGKTTLVKLLVGLYPPGEGQVLFNGIPGTEIDLEELRIQLGFVTQDTQLFSGTIRENLLFVNPEATDADLVVALENAACQSILQRAEGGLETKIGEGGLKLSGGERQRLSIARALLRHPRLLIFDEATSALDSITEEAISQTIRSITAQRTHITVMIAHRLSTILHADRIYVLEKGKIIETGTHYELLTERGLYYAMWRQQIGEEEQVSDAELATLAKN
ncbi:MAG: ABC transporter ATP-binding protein [Sphingobacteriales bacterium]|nr:MAG: ABC transporter ATP-binding protein [Sphingobacteriales bacterium]